MVTVRLRSGLVLVTAFMRRAAKTGMITLSVHWMCWRPVMHAQTWASYSAVYRLFSLFQKPRRPIGADLAARPRRHQPMLTCEIVLKLIYSIILLNCVTFLRQHSICCQAFTFCSCHFYIQILIPQSFEICQGLILGQTHKIHLGVSPTPT